MQFENPRTQRIADQIQRELADLIQRELKDPRIGMVTITAVKVSRELDQASVYFSAMNFSHHPAGENSDEESDDTVIQHSLEGLQKAAGFLRRELSKRLKIRTTPRLNFIVDNSMSEGNRLAALIESANKSV